ncbi:hypothetical protein [Rufibacter sp. LB8]|uniref:hypothetical protein n=1 Tax=Rufibacter sp. LB8 TaxID=2777781 RepID=UPI00178C1C16|nr:hypothetical protein [Rufibacter sp. LB8]
MKILCQTERLKIEHEFDTAFLIDKVTGLVLLEDDFYGDPTCGIIHPSNQWAVIAGEHLVVWTEKETKQIHDDDLKWIHSIRILDSDSVGLLVDPLSEKPAIWKLNVRSFEYNKLRDFTDYQGQEYQENVNW